MKMKVLSIQVNVSMLTEEEADELQYNMEVQCEDAGGKFKDAIVLNSAIKEIEVDDDEPKQGGNNESTDYH